MLAREIMTSDVAYVTANAGVADIARLLVERGVSAVPVVDADLRPIGMVSESDLIASDELRRDERRQWWLAQLAEGQPLDPEFLATISADGRTAHDLMTTPVVCVSETAEVAEIAQLIEQHKFKRTPVLREGKLVGIVSRADLVRAIALQNERKRPPEWLTARRRRVVNLEEPPPPIEKLFPVEKVDQGLPADATADVFRELVQRHEALESNMRADAARVQREARRKRVEELAKQRLSDADWSSLVARARLSAASGAKEFMLIRFPSQLCSDGGRAINAPDPNWPDTLRGEPADIFERWRAELKPRGFQLASQIVDFPDGVPGDAALFLIWGEGP
jgi:CBS domain-containing protein